MEVDRRNFYQKLPDIMDAISSSHAVCIDLEMSGICTNTRGDDRVKMGLGDVYKKAKEAAEAFTILQVGLTCVSWDKETREYVTTTFNIPLAPSIIGDDQVSNELARKVQRQVSFSSQTINFLIANNFDLTKVFEWGVPYLSVEEAGQSQVARWARDRDLDYGDRINIRELPKETQNFCRLMQSTIQSWVTAGIFGEDRAKVLTLTSPYGGRFSPFQKRLIHQVIDTHFFEYRAHSKQGSMSMEVSRGSPKVERKDGRVLALRSQALMKLTGFRFIWDAITGEAFANKIDPETIVGQDSAAIIALRERLRECETRLRKKRPIIVGHNMLHDLCFLFSTFKGKLPDTVREFQELVRGKLVNIVDTKYMFTRGDHEMMPDQSLEECFKAVRDQNGVSIRAKSDAYDYKNARAHQAGYDSFMTATVFLKKAYQISKTQESLKIIPQEDGSAIAANGDVRSPRSFSHTRARTRAAIKSDSLMDDGDDDDDNLATLATTFEPLKPMMASASTSVVNSNREAKPSSDDDDDDDDDDEDKIGCKVPEWDNGLFWKLYGNKVRVGVPAMLLYTGC